MTADRAAALLWAAFLRNRNVEAGTAQDGAIPVAGGFAVYVAGTLVDYAMAAGTTRSLRDDDLIAVEEFYAARAHPARFELDEAVLARDGALLRARGYADDGPALAVLEGPVPPSPSPAPAGRGSAVAVRATTDRRAWTELAARACAGTGSDPALLLQTLQTTAAAAHVLAIASLDGVDIGTGALNVYDDLALLSAAAVLPAYRGRGVHTALVAGRLGLARARGATRAALNALPDSPAERSAAHFAMVRTGMRRRVSRARVAS